MSGVVIAPVLCPKCGVEREGVYMRDVELNDLVCSVCRSDGLSTGAFVDCPIVVPAMSCREGEGREETDRPLDIPSTRAASQSLGASSRQAFDRVLDGGTQSSIRPPGLGVRSIRLGRIL